MSLSSIQQDIQSQVDMDNTILKQYEWTTIVNYIASADKPGVLAVYVGTAKQLHPKMLLLSNSTVTADAIVQVIRTITNVQDVELKEFPCELPDMYPNDANRISEIVTIKQGVMSDFDPQRHIWTLI